MQSSTIIFSEGNKQSCYPYLPNFLEDDLARIHMWNFQWSNIIEIPIPLNLMEVRGSSLRLGDYHVVCARNSGHEVRYHDHVQWKTKIPSVVEWSKITDVFPILLTLECSFEQVEHPKVPWACKLNCPRRHRLGLATKQRPTQTLVVDMGLGIKKIVIINE